MKIETLTIDDAEEALGVMSEAFAAQFRGWGVEVPAKAEGVRVRYRIAGLPHQLGMLVRDDAGEILGVLATTGCGRRCLGGPLAVRPDANAAAVGFALCEHGFGWARETPNLLVEGVTFPGSVRHIVMYKALGMHLGTPILFMEQDRTRAQASVPARAQTLRYSALSASDQADVLAQADALTDFLEPGFTMAAEVRRVEEFGLGDTLLLVRDSRVIGFALCHVGPRSEAFGLDSLLIRAAYQYPGVAEAQDCFAQLIDAAGALARERGASVVEAGVDLRRSGALGTLQRAGFMPHSTWTHVWLGPAERRPVTADQFILEELR